MSSFPAKMPFIQAWSHHVSCAVLQDQLEETALRNSPEHREWNTQVDSKSKKVSEKL